MPIDVTWAEPLPPHFPDPNADPIALLEAALSERDEQISGLYAEAKAWQSQLEAALMRISELGAAHMDLLQESVASKLEARACKCQPL